MPPKNSTGLPKASWSLTLFLTPVCVLISPSQLIYVMATTYNYAVLKFMSHGNRRSAKFSEPY
jgi:hypothetical protein